MVSIIKKYAVYITFGIAFAGIVGSLTFSELLGYPPCVLCWWQRICIYPLAVIALVGILRKDSKVLYYLLPLASIGWCIALYHNLLTWGVVSEALAPCTAGVSCITQPFALFGFITIPFLSLMALSSILVSLIISLRK